MTFDDVQLSIPCPNIVAPATTPTPTATPTATATPGPSPTPAPTYTPVWSDMETISMPVDFENPFLVAGGLPQPFPIPEPDPDNFIDMTVFWDYELLRDFISVIMTMFVLIKKHYIMQAVLIVAVFSLVLVWLVRMVRGRQINV